MNLHICMCVCTYICVYLYVCVCACVYACECVLYLCDVYVFTHTRVCIFSCVRVCLRVCICVYNIHAHTQTLETSFMKQYLYHTMYS